MYNLFSCARRMYAFQGIIKKKTYFNQDRMLNMDIFKLVKLTDITTSTHVVTIGNNVIYTII